MVSDNGKQFNNGPFRDFCTQLGIKNHYSLLAHPQANGQVEVMNRFLLKIIKTRLDGAKGRWPDELLSVLWAYRMIGETHFGLAYGSKVIIPAKVRLISYRVENHDESRNNEAMHLQLDLVDEVKAITKQRLA